MLIGAHVSSGGGLDRAVERGEAIGAESIQIFNQSPRMWRPTKYTEEDFAAFRERIAASPVESAAPHLRLAISLPPAQLREAVDRLAAAWHAADRSPTSVPSAR